MSVALEVGQRSVIGAKVEFPAIASSRVSHRQRSFDATGMSNQHSKPRTIFPISLSPRARMERAGRSVRCSPKLSTRAGRNGQCKLLSNRKRHLERRKEPNVDREQPGPQPQWLTPY